ncbi:hypothetical protein EDB81DRAFT_736152, partial [Dactylonectria macrodidyma]
MDILGQWKKKPATGGTVQGQKARPPPSPPHIPPRREDMMEWEPTPATLSKVNSARSRNLHGYPSKRPQDQALVGKRAKWVNRDEMDARYAEGRCLRCGRGDCRVDTCPLAAAIRPTRV